MNRILYQRKGFTLIELIVVIAILGILAAVLVPSIGNYVTKAKDNKMATEINEVKNFCKLIITEMVNEGYNFSETEEGEINDYIINKLSSENNITVQFSAPSVDARGEDIYIHYMKDEYSLTVSYYDGAVLLMSVTDDYTYLTA